MSKQLILNVPVNFDFKSLNLTRDPITNEVIFNIAPIVEILELSGIDPNMEFTDDQASEILTNLYHFHLSQGEKPVHAMDQMLSDVELEKHFNEIDIIQPTGVKH